MSNRPLDGPALCGRREDELRNADNIMLCVGAFGLAVVLLHRIGWL